MIKKFENYNNYIDYKKGDNVKISIIKNIYHQEIIDYLDDNVGVIHNKEGNFYNVKYDNVPNDLIRFTRFMGTFPDKGLKQQGEIFTAKYKELRLATLPEVKNQMIKKDETKYNL